MQEDLRTPDCMGTRDLRIQDLLRGNGGQPTNLGVGDGEDAVETIDIEILVPYVMRCRREDGDQPAIRQHALARGREGPAGLEVQPRKVPIGFIAVTGEEHAMLLRDGCKRLVLGTVRRDGALLRPLRNRLAPGWSA